MRSLGLVTLVVRDYDEAVAFYVDVLGFELAEDTPLGGGKRWVVVRPGGGAGLLLARAATPAQEARVGDQTGGRVGLFLHTDDLAPTTGGCGWRASSSRRHRARSRTGRSPSSVTCTATAGI